MTTTADPEIQGWLAKEPTWLCPCILQLDGERSTFAAIEDGHWIVVAGVDAGLTASGAFYGYAPILSTRRSILTGCIPFARRDRRPTSV